MRSLLLVIAALGVEPAFADNDPISTRFALRAGLESSSTVKYAQAQDRRQMVGTLGLDVDRFAEQFVFGASLSRGQVPLSFGFVRTSLHAGIQAPSTRARKSATATVHVGMSWFDHICETCRSTGLPFAALRGELGVSGENFEFTVWGAVLVDLASDHIENGDGYLIGGFAYGGGVAIALVSRSHAEP